MLVVVVEVEVPYLLVRMEVEEVHHPLEVAEVVVVDHQTSLVVDHQTSLVVAVVVVDRQASLEVEVVDHQDRSS